MLSVADCQRNLVADYTTLTEYFTLKTTGHKTTAPSADR